LNPQVGSPRDLGVRHTPHSSKDSNVSLKMKIVKKEGVEACSLAHNILGV